MLPFPGMSLEKVILPMMRKLENLFFVKMCLFEALEHGHAIR